MLPALLAAGLPIAMQAGMSYLGNERADDEAERAKQAAFQGAGIQSDYLGRAAQGMQQAMGAAEYDVNQAASLRGAARDRAHGELSDWTERGMGYGEPYYGAGVGATDYLSGYGMPGGPDMLGAWEGSAEREMLQPVLDERFRQTMGQYAAGGLGGSGAVMEDITRRQAMDRLGAYQDWRNKVLGAKENLASRGLRAGEALGSRAMAGGTNLARLTAQAPHADARMQLAQMRLGGAGYLGGIYGQQGAVESAPYATAGRADIGASRAGTDYLAALMGKGSEYGPDLLRQFAPKPDPWASHVSYG